MTPRRPWPNWALRARRDAIELAAQIDKLAAVGRRALENGNHYKVDAVLLEIQVRNTRVMNAMLAVEGDASHVCADCPNALSFDSTREGDSGKIISLRERRGG